MDVRDRCKSHFVNLERPAMVCGQGGQGMFDEISQYRRCKLGFQEVHLQPELE